MLFQQGVCVYAGCLHQTSVDDLHKKCTSRLTAIQINVTSTSDIKRAAEFVEKDLNGKGW